MNFERYVMSYHSVKNEWNLVCNIVSFIRFSQFFELLISFMLDCTLSQENFLTLPPPPTRYLKTLYTDNLYMQYM